MAHAITWFQIPAADTARAKKFYETVCGGGAVPSASGTAVFLNANPDLQAVLDRVEGAGGSIVMPKTAIPMEGAGVFAMIADSEGNTVGLHAQS